MPQLGQSIGTLMDVSLGVHSGTKDQGEPPFSDVRNADTTACRLPADGNPLSPLSLPLCLTATAVSGLNNASGGPRAHRPRRTGIARQRHGPGGSAVADFAGAASLQLPPRRR